MMSDNDTGTPAPDSSGQDAPPEPRNFSQEQVDQIVRERLAKERGKFGDLNELRRKASEFDKIAESSKTEQQKLNEALTAAQAEAAQARTDLLRSKVAADKGLNPAMAARLRGTTEEEIASDADELLAALPQTPKANGARMPAEQLRPVAVTSDSGEQTDMNAWMRSRHTNH